MALGSKTKKKQFRVQLPTKSLATLNLVLPSQSNYSALLIKCNNKSLILSEIKNIH